MKSTDSETLPWASAPATPAKATRKPAPTGPPAEPGTLELVPVPDSDPVDTDQMPRADVLAIWSEKTALLAPLLQEGQALKITDINDVDGMARAKELRTAIRRIRLDVTKKHEELKEFFLRGGQRVDKFKKAIVDAATPMEAYLAEQEEFAALETARLESERRTARLAEILPFLPQGQAPMGDLGTMKESEWVGYLADAKTLHGLRMEREAAERQRIADEEAAERKRLQDEHDARVAEALRIKTEAEATRKENERLRAEREEQDKRIAAERAAIEAERVKAEQAARAEREAEAKRAADERAAQQKLIDEANRKAAALQAEADRKAAEQRMQEAKAKAEAAEAARAAAAAPDKERLAKFAQAILGLTPPTLSGAAKGTQEIVAAKTVAFAKWVMAQAAEL